MITRRELQDYAKTLGFNLYQAEKDYLQHAFLAELYAASTNEFVFKGGTALQKAFHLDRFSEDLDFTLNTPETTQPMEKTINGLNRFVETKVSKQENNTTSIAIKLKLKGPLFDGREKTIQTLTIEESLREKVLQTPEAIRIVPPYDDLRPYVALVMTAEEMLAEKTRAILTRKNARDVYDLWFLLSKNTEVSPELIGEKLKYYGKTFDANEFKTAVEEKEKYWKQELSVLLKNVPDFKQTKEFVLEKWRV